ncbi:gamma-glutamyltransferase family protein [Cupriavidus basilensis]
MSAFKFGNSFRPVIMGRNHMVSSGHYLATQAALRILEEGGNAIDAGVGGGLVLNVVEPQMCSFTGVAPIMIYLAAEQRVVTLDGLGTWPALTTLQHLTRAGEDCVPEGILQTVVPGAPASWLTALEKFGSLSFEAVVQSAIRFAKEGFVVDPMMALTIKNKVADFPAGSSNAAIFLQGDKVPEAGDVFRQPDLASTLQHLIEIERHARTRGRAGAVAAVREEVYTGDLAATFAAHQMQNGGLLRISDLANYSTSMDSPVSIDFCGTDFYACGPWCQGPTLLQILRICEAIGMEGLEHNSAPYLHGLIEAVKLVAADREAFYGDPKFVDVPMDVLLSREYASQRAQQIDPGLACRQMPDAGCIPGFSLSHPGFPARTVESPPLDTSYICAVDRFGNAFSATPSDGIMRKSPIVPGTGLALSARGIQSRLDPKHPACAAPGKRPRLTPNPAIAIRPGEFVMPFGTPGGDLQVQAMAQVILNMFVFGMDAQQAVEEVRVYSYSYPDSFAPHAYYPGVMKAETGIDPAVLEELASKGHIVQSWPAKEWSRTAVCITIDDTKRGIKLGAADSRRMSYALGN